MLDGLRSVLVLVVDDFPDSVDGLTELLCDHGYGVALAFDGKDAVERARAAQPDVIIMDLAMPRLDGLAATRALKADPSTKNIPVLLYTAHPGAEVDVVARTAGCSAVVGKPARPDAMLRAIDDVLQLQAT